MSIISFFIQGQVQSSNINSILSSVHTGDNLPVYIQVIFVAFHKGMLVSAQFVINITVVGYKLLIHLDAQM